MWMSLARSLAARKSSELTSRMIGASSLRVEQVLRLLQLVGDGVEVARLQVADQLLGLVLGAVVDAS